MDALGFYCFSKEIVLTGMACHKIGLTKGCVACRIHMKRVGLYLDISLSLLGLVY